MICTFFGHRDTPKTIEPILQSTLLDLIKNKNVDLFYIGNQGNFDRMVINNLQTLKIKHPNVRYMVVLAYMPKRKAEIGYVSESDTIYPEAIQTVPPKYAISKRNRWMINHSDYVVTYVKSTIGGAYKCKELAERKGKFVINLADSDRKINY